MNDAKKLRRLTIHRSLVRPILFAGGERKLVMLNYTMIAVLLFGAGLSALTIITAVLLGSVGHVCLVKLATYDHLFTQIFIRYRCYQDWYPANPSIWCKQRIVHPAVVKGVRI